MLKRIIALSLLVFSLSFSTGIFSTASAQPTGTSLEETLDNSGIEVPSNLPTLGLEGVNDPVEATEGILLNFVINPIFFISGGVAVIIIMYSAFRVVTSRGEEEGLEAAKKSLTWAFIGLGLIMLSYTIVRNVTGIILQLF